MTDFNYGNLDFALFNVNKSVTQTLQKLFAISRISNYTLRLWSSHNALGMVGMSVLDLRYINGEHTRENVATAVLDIRHELQSQGRILT